MVFRDQVGTALR